MIDETTAPEGFRSVACCPTCRFSYFYFDVFGRCDYGWMARARVPAWGICDRYEGGDGDDEQ